MKCFKPNAYIILIVLLCSISLSFGQLFTYKNISHRDGLPISATWALHEKADGGILIGTSGAGVLEYDGYTFKELIDPTQDNLHNVTGITELKDKTYFVSRFKGLYLLEKNGKLNLLVPTSETGHTLGLYTFNDFIYVISDFGIYEYDISKKTYKFLERFKERSKLELYNCSKSSNSLILFTSFGNFVIDQNRQIYTLNRFFNSELSFLSESKIGYSKNGVLYLLSSDFDKGWIINLQKGALHYKEKAIVSYKKLKLNAKSKSVYNEKRNCFTLFSEDGAIYEESNFIIKEQPKNTKYEELNFNCVITDYNGDYWATSDLNGIFKISIQPFFKVETHEAFADGNIMFVHKTPKKNIIFSTLKGETYSGNPEIGPLKKSMSRIFCSTVIDGRILLGTAKGIYEYKENTNEIVPINVHGFQADTRVQHINYSNGIIWVNIYNVGLYQLDKNCKIIRDFSTNQQAPKIVYTSQLAHDNKHQYFGTSNGIFSFDYATSKFLSIDAQNLGHYCGLSTKDIFGTLWFTLDYGIIGISREGEIYKLSSSKIFPSHLFYTLNSDNNGNLIIGTNKGINVIQVNEKGKILKYRNYDSGTDFGGYETHMRSSFQVGNATYVGTLEGLYKLDFDFLFQMPNPKTPAITISQERDRLNSNIVAIQFLSKNPKTKTVLYSYRIENYQDEWSDLTTNTKISLINLPGDHYKIEVKATYNGVYFSEVSSQSFDVEKPLLRNNYLILLIIVIVVILNSYFYFKIKRNQTLEKFYSEEFYTNHNYAELIILTGLIVHLITNEFAPFISNSIVIDHVLVLITAALMLLCYIFQIKHRKRGKKSIVFRFLAFTIMLSFNLYSLYISSLNPFYAFMIILISSVAPLIFESLRQILIYCIIYIIICIVVILSSEDINYDRHLLIIPIFISAFISVLFNIIRHSSFHQLAFISSIINRSHFIVLAIDKDSKLKFVSKNISNHVLADSRELIDKPITFMDQFIASSEDSKFGNIVNFKDGKTFINPLLNIKQEINWYEWKVKQLSADLTVLIGQDISDKINIQNTYEILVENAEDLIYQIDIEGKFQFINNRFTRYLNEEKDNLIGRTFFDIIPEEYVSSVINFYREQLLNNIKVTYYEFPIIDASGKLQWLGQHVSLLYSVSEANKAVGFLVVARNITQKLKQDSIIAAQSTDIKSSINYAKRIQMNLLPAMDKFQSQFNDSFVYYKPKDIVSGDFYWCNQLGDYTIVAVGDGTGHGVPGAFMSILGINLLNSIILENHIHDPGIILDEMDERLNQMLKEGNIQKINDGMEMTVCVINRKHNTLQYACAGSKMLIHDGENFSIRKGDNKHIGDSRPNFSNYITHHYDLGKETTIYMFTDGYYDQFGGIQQKKFSIKRLIDLFMANIRLPLPSQAVVIASEFVEWMDDNEQTDDVTVVGLRIISPETTVSE